MSAELISYPEETIWKGTVPRATRKPVVFRLTSIGKIRGLRVDVSFVADYGIYFDPEDEYLLERLTSTELAIDWDGLVFHKRPDQSSIDIYDPDDDSLVGRIVTRKRLGGDRAGEISTENVIQMSGHRFAAMDHAQRVEIINLWPKRARRDRAE